MDNEEILNYWNKEDVESMYDKNLLNLEITLIKKHLLPNAKILDAGCGEGEGTKVYASLPNTIIHAVDFSDTRLKKAKENLKEFSNVIFGKIDFLKNHVIDFDFDFIVSQRFLINIMDWELQKAIIQSFIDHLKPGATLILLEGSIDGVNELNGLRNLFNLPEIPIKWHNLFFDDTKLEHFLQSINCEIIEKDGFGEYFMLTRGVRPYFDENTNWDSEFNKFASDIKTKSLISVQDKFSRLKIWIVKKQE